MFWAFAQVYVSGMFVINFVLCFFQCELYHWADVLDLFDGVLENACAHETEKSWTMACDLPENGQVSHFVVFQMTGSSS